MRRHLFTFDKTQGPVMLAINSCVSQSTQKTPYEMVFGQPARSNHDFWLELNANHSNDSTINEEDLPESIVEVLSFNVEEVKIKHVPRHFLYSVP